MNFSSWCRREREFKVVIKLAARADLHHLGLFLQGRQADAPQEALQVLDIVLRELPTSRHNYYHTSLFCFLVSWVGLLNEIIMSSRYCPVARSFYSPDLGRRQTLGEGLESWRGFYQSIRPTQMGLSLNIGIIPTFCWLHFMFPKVKVMFCFFFQFYVFSLSVLFRLSDHSSMDADMSSTAFIEPLHVIDFVTQLLNRDVSSRPLSDADRVKVGCLSLSRF